MRIILPFILGMTLSASLLAGTVTTIPHGIGVYVSPTGRDYFQNSADDLARRFKVNLNHQNLGNKHEDMGEKTLDQLIPDNPKLTSLIKQAKYYFAKFFRSREITFRNKHHLIIDAKNIDVTANWNHVGIDFIKHTHGPTAPTRLTLNLVLNNFRLTVDKVDVKDRLHSFLETIGVDKIIFGSAAGTVPLTFKVPVDVLVQNGKFHFTVYPPETNLDQFRLALDFKKPMRLPVVEIIVNGTRARTRLDEIEKLLRDKRTDLMAGLTKSVSTYLNEDFGPTIQKTLTEKANLKFAASESMKPLGAPSTSVTPFQYKLLPAGLDYKDDHLHFFLNAFIKDPKYSTVPALDDRQTAFLGVQTRTLNRHAFDVAVSLNEGFINQLLQLSDRRGYYDYTTTSDGTQYENVHRPQFALGGRTGLSNGLPPIVKLKIKYNVTGVKQYAVNNPIEVEFDLKLRYPIKNGKAQIVVDGVDRDSVYVAARFARFEILWPKVLEAAKDTLAGMDLSGMVLCDEIPVPTDLFGFPMRITHAEPDANGHILVFMDYDL
ncbi:MAG: hypothetical protein A2X86_03545 [Bdellovibrionales bacterium GWA2_49_15]|nr:MAG: hypothetical protein A2X86_03545 [Bdellovibrionales bacterium GWA2_49_15]HAZ12290.1 hypothetical protein [Bdellovibrionales bacterium]